MKYTHWIYFSDLRQHVEFLPLFSVIYLELQILNFESWTADTEFRISNCRYWISNLELQILNFESRTADTEFRISNCRYWISNLELQILYLCSQTADIVFMFSNCRYWISKSFSGIAFYLICQTILITQSTKAKFSHVWWNMCVHFLVVTQWLWTYPFVHAFKIVNLSWMNFRILPFHKEPLKAQMFPFLG
jgi:hypothetical protein